MILITGGLGYIGSHTVIELLDNGNEVVIVDNLSNSKLEALNRIKLITGKDVPFIKCDVCDKESLNKVFNDYNITSVIHFAGLKAVGESCSIPLNYYRNNIDSTLTLLEVMKDHNVKSIIFSSSATVYGEQKIQPIKESYELHTPSNPYGKTKLYIENILTDLYHSDNSWNICLLRYFNPVGAHKSGLIGEDPNGIPNNLCPYITQVAIGKREKLHIFGNDYNTKDGTGVRDYIHVCDLAIGHVLALNKLNTKPGLVIYNLGTGIGYTVFDVLHAFEKAVGHEIPYDIGPRRPGDLDSAYSDPSKAFEELGFKAKYSIEEMAMDSWNWQKKNPNGLE